MTDESSRTSDEESGDTREVVPELAPPTDVLSARATELARRIADHLEELRKR